MGFLPEIIQAHSNPLQQSLALFFIVVTGKVYALSLMHTINSRQAMRERLKSHDLGRTSLSQFQWSQPRTLVGPNDLPTPEVCDPRWAKRNPHFDSHSIAHVAEHDRGEPGAWPGGTPVTSHGEQCGQQLQASDFTDADHWRTSSPFGDCQLPLTDRGDARGRGRTAAHTTVEFSRSLTIDRDNRSGIQYPPFDVP
jgi:hypothetical protein